MSEAKVGLDNEVRRKTGLENDSNATPTGGAWEGLDGVALGARSAIFASSPWKRSQVSVKNVKSIAFLLM